MNSLDAIKTQVRNGKSAMPAFKRFSDEEVENVAAYVLQQSENDWKS
jgi:cytochrome c6